MKPDFKLLVFDNKRKRTRTKKPQQHKTLHDLADTLDPTPEGELDKFAILAMKKYVDPKTKEEVFTWDYKVENLSTDEFVALLERTKRNVLREEDEE